MPGPLVSVITPTYNHGKFIAQCIQSVLDQTHENWEMIIINDGSTDHTLDVAMHFKEKDSRIRIIDQPNKGVFRLGESYNTALAQANGKYIAILEGDDYWHPDKLRLQVLGMEEHPDVVVSWGQGKVVNEDSTEVIAITPPIRSDSLDLIENARPGSIIELFLDWTWPPAVTVMMRSETLKNIGGFIQSHGTPSVDFQTILRLSLQGPFQFHPTILSYWRSYSSQTTKRYPVEIYEGVKAVATEFISRLYPPGSKVGKKLLNRFNQKCLIAYARSGRFRLIRREFKEARKDYQKAILYPVSGEWTWRLRALVGWMLSFLKMDVEGLAKFLGKASYKEKKK